MATIKVKLRPSSVDGRTGVIFYQVTYRRVTRQITTNLRLRPNEWDATHEQVVLGTANRSIIQDSIAYDTALLKRIIREFEDGRVDY